jgi:protein phosphatase
VNTRSAQYGIYVGATVVAASGVILGISARVVGLDSTFESTSNLLLWMAMITIAATTPLPLPRSSATTTLIPVLDVAGFVLFGPSLGIAFGVLSRLVGLLTERSLGLMVHLSEIGRALLAIGAGATAYAALDGRFGTAAVIGDRAAIALAGGAFAYWAVRTVLGLGDAALRPATSTGRGAGRPLATYWNEQAVVDLVLLPFGVLLALSQIRLGILAAVFFLVPLLLGRYLFRHFAETKRAQTRLVRTLMAALDAVDPFTRGHSYRIAAMSVRVGRALGMSRRALEELEVAALLHDVGRAAIRHEIRVKTGRLTRQEQTQLQAHPQIGHDLLAELPSLAGAAEIVLAHHEQPDGKGYPRALSAAEIPLGSRIIMAVAAFDAMTSDRPYRQGLPPQAAFDELLAHSGTQFFPEVVEALIGLHASGALFEDFEADQLEEYADGRGNSRALEEYAQSRRTAAGQVPTKLGLEGGTGGAEDDGDADQPAGVVRIPMLELPGADESATRAARATNATSAEPAAPAPSCTHMLAGPNGTLIAVAALSDVGCTRKNNEDAYGVFPDEADEGTCLLVLADGMGGAAAGEVASRVAVETVAREHQTAGARAGALSGALAAANRAVHQRANANHAQRGMGTTCTAAEFRDGRWTWAHVGDSRAYVVRAGEIEQVTTDHTLGVELEGRQVANEGPVAGAHHVLTRNLGASPDVQVDTSPAPFVLEPGAALVLCSDGLSNLVEDAEIAEIVTDEDPEEACRTLVDLARARGGPDNITVVVAKAA